jgi:hypothetical protein
VTAVTSQQLADTLRRHGFNELAERAERDEFHDYLSPHDLPEIELDLALVALMKDERLSKEQRAMAADLRQRHHEGAFDASEAESDAWAKSPDGIATFALLETDKDFAAVVDAGLESALRKR